MNTNDKNMINDHDQWPWTDGVEEASVWVQLCRWNWIDSKLNASEIDALKSENVKGQSTIAMWQLQMLILSEEAFVNIWIQLSCFLPHFTIGIGKWKCEK